MKCLCDACEGGVKVRLVGEGCCGFRVLLAEGSKKVEDINDWTGYERDETRTNMTQTLRLDDALTDHS